MTNYDGQFKSAQRETESSMQMLVWYVGGAWVTLLLAGWWVWGE